MNSVTLTFGWTPHNRLVKYRSEAIVNLPLAKIDTKTSSTLGIEVNAVLAKSNLADGVTYEALQR